jgi:hypothetical protein
MCTHTPSALLRHIANTVQYAHFARPPIAFFTRTGLPLENVPCAFFMNFCTDVNRSFSRKKCVARCASVSHVPYLMCFAKVSFSECTRASERV